MAAHAQDAAASTGWLLSKGPRILATKGLHNRFIDERRRTDWFVCLAWAIGEHRKDAVQSRMLCKLYAFILEFMPHGLAGDFAHIRGDEVMDQLLCHCESTASRHRVTRQAETAFAEIENWMGKHKNWMDAVTAKRGKQTKAASKRRGQPSRAPAAQVLSPAGMMAVLVIAYPSHERFTRLIGRLQIEWMMTQAREKLAVRDGFWKGISIDNLYTVFRPAEAREAELPHLADYTQLLGEDFERCRQDLQPHLQPWAQHLSLEEQDPDDVLDNPERSIGEQSSGDQSDERSGEQSGDKSDVDDSEDGSVNGMASMADGSSVHVDISRDDTSVIAETCSFGSRGNFSSVAAQRRLEEWLREKLDSEAPQGTITVLHTWHTYWENCINKAHSVLDQSIVRELFMQSLHRVHSLDAVTPSMAAAYMLVDMEGGMPHPPSTLDTHAALRKMKSLPVWHAFEAANSEFARLVMLSSEHAARFISQTKEVQTRVFSALAPGSPYESYWKSVVEFETVRTGTIIERLRNLSDKILRGLGGSTSVILTKDTIDDLKLTNWQLRALLLPGASYQDVLTDSQRSCFEQKHHRPALVELGVDSIEPLPTYLPGSPTAEGPSNVLNKHRGLPKVSSSTTPIKLLQTGPTKSAGQLEQPATVVRISGTPSPGQRSAGTPALSSSSAMNSKAVIDKPNAFSGSIYVPGKRGPSSHGRNPKKVKFDPEEIASEPQLKEGMQTGFRALQDMLSAAADLLKENVSQNQTINTTCTEVTVKVDKLESKLKSSSEAFDAGLDELRTFGSGLRVDLQTLKSGLEDMKGGLGANLESLRQETERRDDQARSVLDGMKSDLAACARDVEAMGRKTKRMRKELQSQVQDMLDAFNKPAGKPAPQEGEEGFLGVQCPAPPGWNQNAYEIQLERAAWSYICFLGSPDEGVCPDEEALGFVQNQFPELAEGHIVSALGHTHMRVYRHPLGQAARQADENHVAGD